MRILLATDGSDDARRATEFLRQFPVPAGAVVRVVTAVELPPSALDIPPVRDYWRSLLDEGRTVAQGARNVLAPRWPEAEIEVREGDPREEVPAAAEAWKADLVVLGARGLGAVAGTLLGSVSSAVVHHAACPVLVVKGERRAMRHAVVAVDGSADSMAAAHFLAALPLDRSMTVRLVGVVEPPYAPPAPPAVVAMSIGSALDAMLQERQARLEGVLSRVEAAFRDRVGALESSAIVGRPADEIVAAAREPGVDVVVVGARGLGLVRRLALGSVSDRVLHRADCPVLVVKRSA